MTLEAKRSQVLTLEERLERLERLKSLEKKALQEENEKLQEENEELEENLFTRKKIWRKKSKESQS